jgi:hypothetical protein
VDYELHIICGVNPEVTKRSSLSLFKRNFKYEYFHINFLATAKVSNEAGTTPELFFAECSNSDKDMEKRASLCFPVKDSSVDDGMLSTLSSHVHTRCPMVLCCVVVWLAI